MAIAVAQADGSEVALIAAVGGIAPQAEGEVDVAGVVVRIDEVHAKEVAIERVTQPVTGFGLHEDVAPFFVGALLHVPKVATYVELRGPLVGHLILCTDAGRRANCFSPPISAPAPPVRAAWSGAAAGRCALLFVSFSSLNNNIYIRHRHTEKTHSDVWKRRNKPSEPAPQRIAKRAYSIVLAV